MSWWALRWWALRWHLSRDTGRGRHSARGAGARRHPAGSRLVAG